MDINHLRYVVTLAQTRSFSRAAEELYVSQSGLSQQIAKLEKEIGYPLFQRTTKYVHVSPEGNRFVSQAKKVLAEYDALNEQVAATRISMSHTINLGMQVIYRPDVSDTVVRFMQTRPDIDVNLISAWELDLVEMLHSGHVDLALFAIDTKNDDLSGMTVIPFHDERVVAALSPMHPLANRDSITLSDLSEDTLIFTSVRSGVRRLVLQGYRQLGIQPANMMEINDTETRIHYVNQNIGVAFTMENTHHWTQNQDLCSIPIEPAIIRTYALVTTSDGAARHPAAIKSLQNFLISSLSGSADN